MTTWDVLQVRSSGDAGSPRTGHERAAEIERYIYGRWFWLDTTADYVISGNERGMFVHRFLVEDHYADAVVDRLASGLFGARIVARDVIDVIRL